MGNEIENVSTLMGERFEKGLGCYNTRIEKSSSERFKKTNRARKLPYQKFKQLDKDIFKFPDGSELDIFTCPVCRNILIYPVTAECGHTFCTNCLNNIPGKCRKCSGNLTGRKPKVNILIQRLLEKFIEKQEIGVKDQENSINWKWITPEDLECLLCSRYFLAPVTTDCGHTFCRDCLTRVLDHRLPCPLCRTPLSVCDYFKGTTELLHQAVTFFIPEEYNIRMKNNLRTCLTDSQCTNIPVLLCTNAYPGVACPLDVHEARYRLLIRRCLQSSVKKFAMASRDPGGAKFAQYGTVLEIKDALTLEDGRIILASLGVRRFKVVSIGEEDGYDTARIEYIKDVSPLPEKFSEIAALHQKVHNNASKWIESLTPHVLSEIEQLIGIMPEIEQDWVSLPDGPSWTWWLMSIFPFPSQLQVAFLSTTSLEKRLKAIDKTLERMEIRMRAVKRQESVTWTI